MHLRFAICAAILLVGIVRAAEQAGYHPEQLDALNKLYKMAGGPSWIKQDQWNNDLFCLRYGVTCDNNRNVIALKLPSNNLVGSLDISLQQLTALTTLDLPFNKLSGVIPAVAGMVNLTYVDLSHNLIQGPLPDLSRLSPVIQTINLGHNTITGGLSGINILASLVSLDLTNNLLTDSINSVKLVWPMMRELKLKNNLFRGNINWVKSLTAIQNLDISSNQFSGSFDPMGSLTNLKTCFAERNPFSCPVDPKLYRNCTYECSQCATQYSSCDMCLDPSCGWCSTDGTGVNGVCMERSSKFACGGGFGFRLQSCARNCTAEAGSCSNSRLPWSSVCSGTVERRSLTTSCDPNSGFCLFDARQNPCPDVYNKGGVKCSNGICTCSGCQDMECLDNGQCGRCLNRECPYPDNRKYTTCCRSNQFCCVDRGMVTWGPCCSN